VIYAKEKNKQSIQSLTPKCRSFEADSKFIIVDVASSKQTDTV
jgi:hypothetical protein